MRKGISAYWFSNCAVTMEVYALCVSNVPTITMTIGQNRMCEMDVSEINKKLEKVGGSGHVYCYPYDQGPHSTCDNPLPLFPGMTYVCDKPENVYRLETSKIPASGNSFVVWRQKKNVPAEVWMTIDDCEGEVVGRATLSDSLHVFQPDAEMMKEAKTNKRTLWLHVKHDEGIVGRLEYYLNPKVEESGTSVSRTTCLGKTQTFNQRIYSADTTFVDTVRIGIDTLQTTPVTFTFTQPRVTYDTLKVDAATLSRGYRHSPTGVVLFEYGDTLIDVVKTNTCTKRYMVTVLNPEGIDDRKYNVLGQPINNK